MIDTSRVWDAVRDMISDEGRTVLSLAWDGNGPAHSGCHHVVEWRGLYFFQSSDLDAEGPFDSLEEALALECFQVQTAHPEITASGIDRAALLRLARDVVGGNGECVLINGARYTLEDGELRPDSVQPEAHAWEQDPPGSGARSVPPAKLLGDPQMRHERLGMVHTAHVAPLNQLVADIRRDRDCGEAVPWFDPLDGGVKARVLFVLEAPGPRAVASGFVSRDNPDESAKNWLLALQAAGLPREETVLWNIVPWYVGDGTRIRAAGPRDISEGLPYLDRLIQLLPRLSVIGLVGGKAQSVEARVADMRGDVKFARVPHPSPQFVNRRPENRAALTQALVHVRDLVLPS